MTTARDSFVSANPLALTERSVADPLFWEFFANSSSTNFQGVPYTYEMLQRSGFLNQGYPLLRHFTQAGGRLEPAAVQLFGTYAKDHGARFYVMYGQTEASPRISYVMPQDVLTHADTIGKAIPGGRLSLETLDGVPATDGVAGELIYHGPNVMMGYALERTDLARPHEIAELRTGDLAVRVSHGYYQITGRASRFLKLFGLRIGLDEIEQRLRSVGIEATAAGNDKQLVLALVGSYDRAALADVVEGNVGLTPAAYRIVQFSEIPRLDSGKIDYRVIMATRSDTPMGWREFAGGRPDIVPRSRSRRVP